MFSEKEIPICDFVYAISDAVDLIAPVLNNHHKTVTYIAWRIGQEMGLTKSELQKIVLASKLHDIGAFSLKDRAMIQVFEADTKAMDNHVLLGYKLFKDFGPLSAAAELIKYHHTPYDRAKTQVPIGSYIIHLADRVSVLISERQEILHQTPKIMERLAQRADLFHPIVFNAFERLAEREYFWVEAASPALCDSEVKKEGCAADPIDLAVFRSFAKLFAQIIDFRSRFTATHSSGVAAVASELTRIAGFSKQDCDLMEIAGYLHDLGKLAVPNEILEKNDALTTEEFNHVKKHTYYTYSILNTIKGMENIATWAAYHHERQDGSGYPFRVKSADFSTKAQIMAVSDIVTALSEDRPYRKGMGKEQILKVLFDFTQKGRLDKSIVEMACEEFDCINSARAKAQQKAHLEYRGFYDLYDPEKDSEKWEKKIPA